jgi:hypothetical protein
MSRLLILLSLTPLFAFAQDAAEAPVEKASPLTVIVFLALFVGSCIGYFAYIWWQKKKSHNDK